MKHTEYIIPIGEDALDYDEMFIGVIRRQPELVRCKKCRYWGQDGYREGCKYAVTIMAEDDFCSNAEPKENG